MKINELIKIIKKGGIGVLPTDTLYGLVGAAFSQKAVARIYKVRRRNPKKPLIILIGSFGDLKKLGIRTDGRINGFLKKIWPGPVSVILPCPAKKFYYLHRGTKTLAVRMPKLSWLRQLIGKTGPLVAPSANLAGRPPALTVKEAKKYFNKRVDFYLNRGRRLSSPSLLIEIRR